MGYGLFAREALLFCVAFGWMEVMGMGYAFWGRVDVYDNDHVSTSK